jgi:hypothetical protein
VPDQTEEYALGQVNDGNAVVPFAALVAMCLVLAYKLLRLGHIIQGKREPFLRICTGIAMRFSHQNSEGDHAQNYRFDDDSRDRYRLRGAKL